MNTRFKAAKFFPSSHTLEQFWRASNDEADIQNGR